MVHLKLNAVFYRYGLKGKRGALLERGGIEVESVDKGKNDLMFIGRGGPDLLREVPLLGVLQIPKGLGCAVRETRVAVLFNLGVEGEVRKSHLNFKNR